MYKITDEDGQEYEFDKYEMWELLNGAINSEKGNECWAPMILKAKTIFRSVQISDSY